MAARFAVEPLHHEVLRDWARVRRSMPDSPAPLVLTLDHHSDVMTAFRDAKRRVAPGCWRDADAVESAIAELRHDEHLDWAVRSDLVSRVFVLAKVHTTTPASDRIEVLAAPGFPDENKLLNHPEEFRSLNAKILDSDYLRPVLPLADLLHSPLILDVDCDCIGSGAALAPQDAGVIRVLAQHAMLVTLSLESDYVRLLRLPGETVTAEEIARRLQQLLG